MRSPTLRVRARGPWACFTRPELKVERVSYSVMTPSAARGLLEAILWKPAIAWHIEQIAVLSPIRFVAFRRNEVSTKASAPAAAIVADGGLISPYFADDDRAQRNTLALADVDYRIDAHFTLTERAGAEDTVVKFVEMFTRRLGKGQHFHQPYFGCREFAAEVEPADGAPAPIDDDRDLGLMLWDIEYAPKHNRPIFFPARLEAGVLAVPPREAFAGVAGEGA
jgi:CRISPR-associated protein Cas5d